ncbi:hypothetical protein [Sporosarcina sp. A2]|uniref:hypothetical protein n=1 Tax=Sporosarcina sp. A2 TaxID=3393449 RepID=UPI003D78E371
MNIESDKVEQLLASTSIISVDGLQGLLFLVVSNIPVIVLYRAMKNDSKTSYLAALLGSLGVCIAFVTLANIWSLPVPIIIFSVSILIALFSVTRK